MRRVYMCGLVYAHSFMYHSVASMCHALGINGQPCGLARRVPRIGVFWEAPSWWVDSPQSRNEHGRHMCEAPAPTPGMETPNPHPSPPPLTPLPNSHTPLAPAKLAISPPPAPSAVFIRRETCELPGSRADGVVFGAQCLTKTQAPYDEVVNNSKAA